MIPLTLSTLLWALTAGLDLFAITRAVTRAHGVERTIAWVLAILAFPGLGAITYLLIASPSVGRTTRKKRMAKAAIRRALATRAGVGRLGSAAAERTPEATVLHLAAAVTGLVPTSGNEVELLAESDSAFDSIEEALRAARHRVWAEYYIIRNDETGNRFLDLLLQKAKEGVEVRLLHDAVGSMGVCAERIKAILAAGGHAEMFLPVNPLRRRWAVHLRNHRKLIVVDGEIGFLGGMNVGDEYSGRARRRGGQHFRDTHLRVRGPAVADLAQTFAEDWAFATGETLETAVAIALRAKAPGRAARQDGSVVAVLPSGPDQEHNANAMVYFAGITGATERLYLTSPYFIPDEPTIRALESAALRGVDVRLLVPDRCDVFAVGPAARSYFPALLAAGVRVYAYKRSMLHAKTMVVDGRWGIVGSANVDIRSFRLNFEIGAVIADPAFAARMAVRFLADLEESAEVTAEAVARRGLLRRMQEGTARLLSPLL